LRKVLFSTFASIAGAAYQEAIIPTYNADGVTIASFALHLIVGSTGVEVANGVNVSTTSVSLIVEGN
jgi:hypothetical protein